MSPHTAVKSVGSGPAFVHRNGSEMKDEFAFDIYHRTREEWDKEQRGWEERSKRFEAEKFEPKRLGVANSIATEAGPRAIWSRSVTVRKRVRTI